MLNSVEDNTVDLTEVSGRTRGINGHLGRNSWSGDDKYVCKDTHERNNSSDHSKRINTRENRQIVWQASTNSTA